MNKLMMQAVSAITLAVSLVGTAAAQTSADPAKVRAEMDKAIEVLRKDVRAGKADILGKTMALDATQAAAFWPVYKKYEADVQVLNNDRLSMIKDFANQYDSLDDAKAKALIDRQIAFEEKRTALIKKCKDEMLKSLPAKTVGRWLQVESRLGKIIDIAIANDIPLVY